MKISIAISVTSSNWRKDAPEAERGIEVSVPEDTALLFDNVRFGELVTEAIASAVEEYVRRTNLPGLLVEAGKDGSEK